MSAASLVTISHLLPEKIEAKCSSSEAQRQVYFAAWAEACASNHYRRSELLKKRRAVENLIRVFYADSAASALRDWAMSIKLPLGKTKSTPTAEAQARPPGP